MRKFNYMNKNRLLNILRKVIIDEDFLIEINKLFVFNIVNFSTDNIYISRFGVWGGELSRFLTLILLEELDIFLFNLSGAYQLKFLNKSNSFFHSEILHKKMFLPVKLNKLLLKFGSLRSIFNINCSKVERTLNNCLIFTNDLFFLKTFFYARYLDYLLLGIKGSNKFALNVSKKLSNFVRSRIHFDIQKLESILCKETSIFFAGFNIRLCFVLFILMLY